MKNLTSPTLLKRDGKLDIYFVPLIEYMSLAESFEVENVPELIEKLDRYDAVWFCAKVFATFNGLELSASDYLGGCYYENYEEFYQGKDYILDMIRTVEKEAKKELIELKKEIELTLK